MILKGHDRRTKKKSGFEPRRTAFEDPPPEFRQDFMLKSRLYYMSGRFASFILFQI